MQESITRKSDPYGNCTEIDADDDSQYLNVYGELFPVNYTTTVITLHFFQSVLKLQTICFKISVCGFVCLFMLVQDDANTSYQVMLKIPKWL